MVRLSPVLTLSAEPASELLISAAVLFPAFGSPVVEPVPFLHANPAHMSRETIRNIRGIVICPLQFQFIKSKVIIRRA
jgi:hypothetical protein